MKLGSTVHPIPTEAEQLWLDLSDRFYEQLERRGERAAVAFAKRAGSAALNGDTTVNRLSKAASPDTALAMLQELRNDAENEGDFDTADGYNDAIRSLLATNGTAPAAAADPLADDTALSINDDEPADAMALGKTIRKGQAAFLAQYGNLHANDIRKRPAPLRDDFAQSPPRANPVAPMMPSADTQKIAKAKGELEEAQVRNQILEVYRRGTIK